MASAAAAALSWSETGVTHLLSPGLEAALQQFANPEALAAGKVCVLGLDTVVERFGSRWPMRRDQVHEHVQATLDRQLGPQAFHLRISDADFLVCQPETAPLLGQAACLRALREIVEHFLGVGEQADIGVHQVVSLSPRGVQAIRVDPQAAAAAEAEAARSRLALPAAEDTASLGAVDIWTPFVAANGRPVEVSCTLDTVRELKGGAVIGFRLSRHVKDARTGITFAPAELERLSRSDRLRIDFGGIVQGMKLLRAAAEPSRPLALIVPVSFSSLSGIEDRARIVNAFTEAQRYAAKGVICELTEIDGVPAATLAAAAAMIRPYSILVIGHLSDPTAVRGRVLTETGLRAVSLACPACIGDVEFIGWAKSAVGAAKRAAKGVILYRVPSARMGRAVLALGATHASLSTD